MSVELRPLNVLCNIQCKYCYQEPLRSSNTISRSYDLAKMKDAVLAEGGPFTLFGGEPLLLPFEDLEDLWQWGFEQFGHNSVQTNGTLVSERHIELFRKYNVHVGISIDGPGELNDVRWHSTLERTRESTAATLRAIDQLCARELYPNLIVTLHRGNASQNRLPALTAWIRDLHQRGINSIRLHLLESESRDIYERYALTTQENIDALRAFIALERELPTLRFDLFREMKRLLVGDDKLTTCVWYGCDPYTTTAVRGVEGNGQRSNCGRTNKDGIDFVKASSSSYERYLALYQTPQEFGGCSDCRFFLMCKGQCPGTSIGGDWRNRSEHCEIWKAIFEQLEDELLRAGISPLSVASNRLEIEDRAIQMWCEGQPVSMQQLMNKATSSVK